MTRQPPLRLAPRALVYWPVFVSVADRHGLDALLLTSICDVETECGTSSLLDRPGPGGRGDKGHGHGLFQIDDRTPGHKLFLEETNAQGVPLWTLPEENTEYACSAVLGPAFTFFHGLWVPTIASFNAGVHAVQRELGELTFPKAPEAILKACNKVTASPHNYVTRVLNRFHDFGGEMPGHESTR